MIRVDKGRLSGITGGSSDPRITLYPTTRVAPLESSLVATVGFFARHPHATHGTDATNNIIWCRRGLPDTRGLSWFARLTSLSFSGLGICCLRLKSERPTGPWERGGPSGPVLGSCCEEKSRECEGRTRGVVCSCGTESEVGDAGGVVVIPAPMR